MNRAMRLSATMKKAACCLLFVVHIELEGEFIRLISARKTTLTERNNYDF